jgi:hypothetical protein
MHLAIIALATALGFGTVSMTTAGMAFGNDGGRAFGHSFDKRLRFHKTFVIPYPYYDYDYPTDAFDDYPPPVTSVPVPPPSSPSACHRGEETFTVPAEGGGTRQIKIINCP